MAPYKIRLVREWAIQTWEHMAAMDIESASQIWDSSPIKKQDELSICVKYVLGLFRDKTQYLNIPHCTRWQKKKHC